jgi:hypothetical protein
MDIKVMGICIVGDEIHKFGVKNNKLYISYTIFYNQSSDWVVVDVKKLRMLRGDSPVLSFCMKYQNMIDRDIKLNTILNENNLHG